MRKCLFVLMDGLESSPNRPGLSEIEQLHEVSLRSWGLRCLATRRRPSMAALGNARWCLRHGKGLSFFPFFSPARTTTCCTQLSPMSSRSVRFFRHRPGRPLLNTEPNELCASCSWASGLLLFHAGAVDLGNPSKQVGTILPANTYHMPKQS